MAATKEREWEPYSVGKPSTRTNWTNADCSPFDPVYHICHISDAFRLFEDRRIRSSLVWDESKLKNTRTCVAWLSPNLSANGSLYGNIRFDFDWRDLIEGKKFYWVEAIRYRPPANRILITDKQPSLDLERYRPEEGNGPLYHDSGNDVWYCNGNYTGEFMLHRIDHLVSSFIFFDQPVDQGIDLRPILRTNVGGIVAQVLEVLILLKCRYSVFRPF